VESYRLCCVIVCDLETSRIGAPYIYIYIYIYDISRPRVNILYCGHAWIEDSVQCDWATSERPRIYGSIPGRGMRILFLKAFGLWAGIA